MIAEQLNSVVIKLFIRRRKLNIYLIFIIQCYFAVSKYFRLNPIHYIFMKIPDKRELQQIAFKHSSDINFQDFMNLYKKYCKTIFFLVIDTTLTSDISSRFRRNLLERM